jgi:hypothetical protein
MNRMLRIALVMGLAAGATIGGAPDGHELSFARPLSPT